MAVCVKEALVNLKQLGPKEQNYFVTHSTLPYILLNRRGKIAIYKFGERKPCFVQRVRFRSTSIEQGLYPTMGFQLRGIWFDYFADWQPFSLQRICTRKIIESFVNLDTGKCYFSTQFRAHWNICYAENLFSTKEVQH